MLEEKILAALEKLQTDISGLKTDVSGLKAGQDAMQADISGIKVRLDTEIERKINLLAEGQELMLEKLERLDDMEVMDTRITALEAMVKSTVVPPTDRYFRVSRPGGIFALMSNISFVNHVSGITERRNSL